MSKAKTETPIALTAQQKDMVAALEHLFTVGGWEIPDSAVEGKLTAKVLSLEAQVKSLTQRCLELQTRIEGTPVTSGRVDVLAATSKKKGEKK